MTITMATPLNGKQKRYLRALAHDKKPIVQLGKEGLTAAVCSQIDASLETHELIKVKVGTADGDDLEAMGREIEQKTRSQLCQVIGKTMLFYRRRAKNATIVLPTRARTAKSSEGKGKAS